MNHTRMRIAMIGQKGIPTKFGGVERHVESLATRLGALGADVTVYTRRWYAEPQADFAPGLRTVATPSLKTKHLDAITHTFTSTLHALATGTDIIHYQGVGPSLLAWLPRMLAPRVRVVSTFHSIDRKHQKWGPFAKFALRLGELAACKLPHETIVISQGLRAYSFDRYSASARYIPNGVTRPSGSVAQAPLAAFGLEPGRYLVASGRLIRLKGVHHLIRAYRALKAAGRHGGLKLAVVGGATYSEGYVVELRALAGDEADIVFTGFRQGETLDALIAHAYAFVHPSETEGLSLAVLEAMAHGRAVLASDIPGNTEAIGRHGLTFRSKDVADLSAKLESLIKSPELAQRLGASAREHVLKHYDWDDIAAATWRLYHEVTGEAPAAAVRLPKPT
jgi:glycosyltransferase involved in cell wall biosynthesis